jgi:hypothetical protein
LFIDVGCVSVALPSLRLPDGWLARGASSTVKIRPSPSPSVDFADSRATEPGPFGQLRGKISARDEDSDCRHPVRCLATRGSYRISAEPVDFSGGFPAGKARRC